MNRSSGGGRPHEHAAMTKLASLLERRLAASEGVPVSGVHPDADVLSAFAERTLSPKERDSIIAHLAGCSECREVLALSSATQPIDANPPRSSEARAAAWWAWRFAAVAALAVIIATLWLPLPDTKRSDRVPKIQAWSAEVLAPSRPAQDAASPVQPIISPAAEPQRSSATAKKQAPRLTRTPESKAKMIVPPPAAFKINPSEKVLQGAGLPPPNTTYIAPLFPQFLIPSPSVLQSPVSTEAPSTQLTATAAAAAPTTNYAKSAEASAEAQATLSVRAKPSSASRTSKGLLNSSAFAFSRLPSAALKTEPASAKSRGDDVVHSEEIKRAEDISHARDLWMLPSPANAGVIEKSRDDGKTWQTIRVDSATDFNALSSAGKDVWVGGANGKLFRSSDSGAHWSAVPVSEGSIQLRDVISSIDIRGAFVTLKTGSGASWTTLDSGVHWHLQR